MSSEIVFKELGVDDETYRQAGGLEGITRLVNAFYHNMDTLPQARELRGMHPEDLSLSRKKLVYFLSGWMGGPKLFAEHYGAIQIPAAHKHLPVTHSSMQAWLDCMALALSQLGYDENFQSYIVEKLTNPAKSILYMAEFYHTK